MSWGGLLALLALVGVVVLILTGRLDLPQALLFGALAVAILLSSLPLTIRRLE